MVHDLSEHFSAKNIFFFYCEHSMLPVTLTNNIDKHAIFICYSIGFIYIAQTILTFLLLFSISFGGLGQIE